MLNRNFCCLLVIFIQLKAQSVCLLLHFPFCSPGLMFEAHVVGSLPYNVKLLEATFVVIWLYIN